MVGFAGRTILYHYFRREPPLQTSLAVVICVTAILFWTGLQDSSTSEKLALFSGKLSLVIFAAAVIRVREGLPWVPAGLPNYGETTPFEEVLRSFAMIVSIFGPLIFLSADFGFRAGGKRPVLLTGVIGIAVPFTVIQILTAITELATLHSSRYTPSVEATVAMALFSGTSGSAFPSRLAVAWITTFGSARFCVHALRDSVLPSRFSPKVRWPLLKGFALLAVTLALGPFEGFSGSPPVPTTCLVVTAGVLTAEFLAGARGGYRIRAIDWIGLMALVAGVTVALRIEISSIDSAWNAGLLWGYGVAFATCLAGRLAQHGFRALSPH